MKEKLIQFLKLRRWFVVAGVIILAVVVLMVARNGGNGVEKLTVMRGEVISEVSVTGQVKPARSIDLAFEKSGRIAGVAVEVGTHVVRGSRLVSIENADLQAQLAQAQATLKQQQAKLDELNKGTRPEELAAKRAELDKVKEDLASYYDNVVNVVNDAFAKADDAVRTKADAIFTNGDTTTPSLVFTIADSQIQVDVVALRVAVRDGLGAWRNELSTARNAPTRENLEALLASAEKYLSLTRTFLTKALDAANRASGVASATLDTYKLNINTGLANVNAVASSVNAQRQSIAVQKLIVQKIQSEYEVKVAGATQEQVTAQEAMVEQAQGQIDFHLSQIAKTVLRAPFAGVVTKVNNREGEIAAANTPAVSLVGEGKYEIEAYIAESDIAKVKTGDTARVTLDAYGSGVLFEAAVTQIDLSETLLEGVATYKTVLQFAESDERILPGLTANVDILSEKKEDALYVPTRNVETKDGRHFVKIISEKGAVREVEVETGIRGSDGRTEILLGLAEGEALATGQ